MEVKLRVTVDLDKPTPYEDNLSGLALLRKSMTYRFHMRILRKIFGKREFGILDIGSGSGRFLQAVREHFPNSIISGVEYDPRLVEKSNLVLGAPVCQQGNAEDLSGISKRFDCIASHQVIEHLYSPESFLTTIPKILVPGGIFILTTPNTDCVAHKILGDRWQGIRSDHVSLKNVVEWDKLIRSFGFQPVFVGSTFFSGIPMLNRLPFGVLNWGPLYTFGAIRWNYGESFVGVYRLR